MGRGDEIREEFAGWCRAGGAANRNEVEVQVKGPSAGAIQLMGDDHPLDVRDGFSAVDADEAPRRQSKFSLRLEDVGVRFWWFLVEASTAPRPGYGVETGRR